MGMRHHANSQRNYYPSETELILLHLKYFQHMNTKKFDWAHKTPEEIALYTPSNSTVSAGQSVGILWFKARILLIYYNFFLAE